MLLSIGKLVYIVLPLACFASCLHDAFNLIGCRQRHCFMKFFEKYECGLLSYRWGNQFLERRIRFLSIRISWIFRGVICPWALKCFIPKLQGSKLFFTNFRNGSTHLPAVNNGSFPIHQFAGATDVLPSTRCSYQISLTWLWSTRAGVTDRDRTVQCRIRTSAILTFGVRVSRLYHSATRSPMEKSVPKAVRFFRPTKVSYLEV